VKPSRFSLLALVVSASIVSLTGCTSSSNVVSPTANLDTTPPAAPTNVHGTYDANANRDYLNWDASSSADVSLYEVWQYSDDPALSTASTRIGTVVVGQSSMLLPQAPASGTMYYRVRAVDTSFNRSAFSATATVDLHGDQPGGGSGGGRHDPNIY
jgi:predicted phage tail protein